MAIVGNDVDAVVQYGGLVVVGLRCLTNIRYFIRLGAHSAPSLTAALRQASVAERRARAPACALHEAE